MNDSDLRSEVQRLRDQQQTLADLIGCADPAKLEHDLRNVLNELVMLRRLAEMEDDE